MSSLGKVIILYLQHSSVAKRTAKNNALALLKIFEKVRGHQVVSELVPLADVNAALIPAYQSQAEREYCAQAADDPPTQREAKERALRSTRSTIRQARCLFSRRGDVDMIQVYREHGIEIPECVFLFCSCKVRGRNGKTDYRAPDDSLVKETIERIELMRSDKSVYIGFWVALGSGLRRKEIRFTRWEYLRLVDGHPRIIGGIGKDGEQINVPMQSQAFERLLPFKLEWESRVLTARNLNMKPPEGWMIPERGDEWCQRLSLWLRDLGCNTQKTLHELRAYTGSLIYARDPVAAMRFLRHKSIQVTERNYVRYQLTAPVVDVL